MVVQIHLGKKAFSNQFTFKINKMLLILIVSCFYLIGRKRLKQARPKRQVPLFAAFLLVLVRLRLGLLVGHLADIYSLSKWSVSKIFTTWINMLYHAFKDILIAWPKRQQVKRHLPKSFPKFPWTRVIIDCTEIKIQKPTAHLHSKLHGAIIKAQTLLNF